MSGLIVVCQIADTFADMLFTGMLDVAYAVHAVLSLTAVGNIADTGSLELNGPRDIAMFESGGHTYAASFEDHCVQILNITDPSSITATDSIRDGGSRVLEGARGIAIFESGAHTYAAVRGDSVQILNITYPSSITAAGHITDTPSLAINNAIGITTFVSDGHTYAAVAAFDDNGVQILDVTNPSNITAADSITNTSSLKLLGAYGITTFVSGGHTYAAVAASADSGVQIIRIDIIEPDTTPPTITITGSNPVTVPVGTAYTDAGAVCEDAVDDSHALRPSGSVDTATIGTHYIIYVCYDESKNHASAVRTVIVTTADDTTPPVITLTGYNPTVSTVGDTYTEQGAVCDDDVDADKPATPSGTVDTLTPGSYTLTYSCVDMLGNPAADVTRIVRVDAAPDNTPPVITASMSESDSRYAAHSSVGVHAYRDVVP